MFPLYQMYVHLVKRVFLKLDIVKSIQEDYGNSTMPIPSGFAVIFVP